MTTLLVFFTLRAYGLPVQARAIERPQVDHLGVYAISSAAFTASGVMAE